MRESPASHVTWLEIDKRNGSETSGDLHDALERLDRVDLHVAFAHSYLYILYRITLTCSARRLEHHHLQAF